MIRLILNILWFVLGGWLSGLLWLFGGAILALTVVGLPWTFAAWRIASYSFWPFGREVVWQDAHPVAGCLGVVLNIIWFVVAGVWLAIGHVTTAAALAVTIIGLPMAWANLKLIPVTLFPLGKRVVPSTTAFGTVAP